METWFAAAKIFGGIILTTFINKLLSIFRLRQLYLSYDDILESSDSNARGFTASIKLYNRGKDKEKSIQVIFPNITLCQILSTDFPGAHAEGNILKIDRLLPGQTLSLNVFLAGLEKPNSKSKPFIKSEDSNGKAFANRGNVPPSLGPVIWALSITTTVLFGLLYILNTNKDPFSLYFKWNNSDFTSQGLEPDFAISEKLVSLKSSNEPYPIKVLEPTYETNGITLSFEVYNPTTDSIRLKVSYRIGEKDFMNDIRALNRLSVGPEYREASAALWYKYGFNGYPDTAEITIEPKQKTVVKIYRHILETTQMWNLDLYFDFDGTLPNKEYFSDGYKFYAENSKFKLQISEHIDKTKTALLNNVKPPKPIENPEKNRRQQ